MDLLVLFQEINALHFDGFLEPPVLRWNGRLRTSAGRFFPGTRRRLLANRPPIIEVASYLQQEQESELHVRETLAHEMIHYWLWVRNRPYGHTDEFYSKMQLMGARRYNPVPKLRPYKYIYGCSHCQTQFKTRRILGRLACAKCCRRHGDGKYQERFRLVMVEKIVKKLAASAALMVFLFPLAASAFAGKAPKTTLWMSKSDGALQCEPPLTQGAVESQREKLKSEGLQLLEWQHLSAGQGDGKMRIMLCGSPVGSRYRIQISSEQKPLAERLGFQAE